MEIDVNDANFEKEVVEKSKKTPVVVDFWASWCMPCTVLKPVLEKLAEEMEGKFLLAKLNVDENPATSAKYGISGIPDVRMFKNGEIVSNFTGSIPEESVKKWLEKALG